jgi:hypothetical protein
MIKVVANLTLAGTLGGLSAYLFSLLFPIGPSIVLGLLIVGLYLVTWMFAMDDPANNIPKGW